MTNDPIRSPGIVIDPARLDANWRAINVELDVPRPSRMERALRSVGLPSRVTRLVVATPALRRAWYLAMFGAVLLGLAGADAGAPRQSLLVLLTLAPLVPVLGVAMAYGPGSDPAYELQLATPARGVRVVAIRSLVVLSVSAVVVTLLTLTSEVARPFAAAWLLPALAVTTTALALMTVLTPRQGSIVASVTWFVVVLVSQAGADPLTAFLPIGQLIALLIAGAMTITIVVRRRAFDRLVMA